MKKKEESHLTSRGKRNLSKEARLCKGTEVGRDFDGSKRREHARGSCRRKGLLIFRK